MTTCVCCKCTKITWAEQRRQFARAIKHYGLTPDEAKKVMPRCQVCLTNLLGRRAGFPGRSNPRTSPEL